MNLSSTSLGPFKLHTIDCGRFKLDGGAMFGVVPKTLWSKQIAADHNNRIPMAMRSLLITSEATGKVYLIDNGIGTKFDEKFSKIYGLNLEEADLQQSLKYHGYSPSDITDIIFTHLHFDHCGGTTYYDDNGELAHLFPNATYHVTESHWQTAIDPNAREKASFLKENIAPIAKSDQLNLIKEGYQFEEGLSHIIVNGHTIGQQLPKISYKDRTIVFVADLLPTAVHVPVPWVMAYDMFPAETLIEKKNFLDLANNHNWYLYFEHDGTNEVGTITKSADKFTLDQTMSLTDI